MRTMTRTKKTPKDAKWIVMQPDGSAFFYHHNSRPEIKPSIDRGSWVASLNGHWSSASWDHDNYCDDWKNSLCWLVNKKRIKFSQKDFEKLIKKLAEATNNEASIKILFTSKPNNLLRTSYSVFYNDYVFTSYKLNELIKRINDIINESTKGK